VIILNSIFRNPIKNTFELIENYRNELKKSLKENSLSESSIRQIVENIKMDNRVFISLNKKYKSGHYSFSEFCTINDLSQKLCQMFSVINDYGLYYHQEQAIESILEQNTTIVSTGTGSGKTESFLIPIMDYCLRNRGEGIKALIVYPMNALANDQLERIVNYTENTGITFGSFTGNTPQNSSKETAKRLSENHLVYRDEILENPPDILITNYVMLERLISRSSSIGMFKEVGLLKYLVIDEVHTYRGNKATHLKYLLTRLKYIIRNEIVQIASSATLARTSDEIDAYSHEEGLDDFIKQFFDVDSYRMIEATYRENSLTNMGIPDYQKSINYSWERVVDFETGIGKVHALVYGDQEYFSKEEITDTMINDLVEKFKGNGLLVQISKILNDGSICFNDFVDIIINHFQKIRMGRCSEEKAAELARSFLTAVTFLNFIREDQDFLDIRVHLFLQNIGGSLKRCIRCKTYHSGIETVCTECGTPLFYVDGDNISHCIGKASGRYLRPKLKGESDDPNITYYVSLSSSDDMIDNIDSAGKERQILSFSLDSNILQTDAEIYLQYKRDGELNLEYLENNQEEVYKRLIPLSPQFRKYKYLYILIQDYLGNSPEDNKKLIAFIDNKEKASRYTMTLRDEFVSDFFKELLKLYNFRNDRLSLGEAVEIIKKNIEKNAKTEMEHQLINDLNYWLYRLISTQELFINERNIQFKDDLEDYSDIAAELIKIFISERAIYKDLDKLKIVNTKYLSLHKERVISHKGIYFDSHSDCQDSSFLYQGISLGQEGRKYKKFINKYKAAEVKKTISRLYSQGIIKKRKVSIEREHYYLNPDYLVFNLPEPEYRSYEEIRQRYLFFTGLHSSEVKSCQRREIEEKFRSGDINFLISTPTLEMGIDIGNLKNVLMIGVPPLPSNYAQRAGRAGRGSRGNFAVIITFCYESKSHDQYYYNNPSRMIDGLIIAPTFDPGNRAIIEKHINVFILVNYLESRKQLVHFIDNYRYEIDKILPKVNAIFPGSKENKTYLYHKFLEKFIEIKRRYERNDSNSRKNRSLRNFTEYLYQHNFFPDYNFSREEITVYDRAVVEDHLKKRTGIPGGVKLAETVAPEDVSGIEALSVRSPEQAYYKFCPGNTVSIAGSEYRILDDGNYSVVKGEYHDKRSYQSFLAEKKENYLSSSREDKRYRRAEFFNYDDSHMVNKFTLKKKIFEVNYYPEVDISYINYGVVNYSDEDLFKDNNRPYILDFKMKREALVFEFDKKIFSDESYYVSFISLLDRTVKDEFGLDESGIKVLIDIIPRSEDESLREEKVFALFYDYIGNGNVPFELIFNKFEELITIADKNLRRCSCNNGCYLCMKSYNTQFYASLIDKQIAEMITGYLLGKNYFKPSLFSGISDQMVKYEKRYDLELKVLIKGQKIILNLNDKIQIESDIIGDQNQFIFNTLNDRVISLLNNNRLNVKILSNQDYLVDAFNELKINKGKNEFSRLLFNMLCWNYYQAEKI